MLKSLFDNRKRYYATYLQVKKEFVTDVIIEK